MPYIVRNHTVDWNLPQEEVYVTDFLATHQNSENQLDVLYYSLAVGGGGESTLVDIQSLWEHFFVLLSVAGSAWTVAGFPTIKDATLWMKDKFVKNSVRPSAVFSLILSRKRWNPIELGEYIDVEKDVAQNLLRVCQYEWKPQDMMYVQTDRTADVIQKLQSAEYWNRDVGDHDDYKKWLG